MEPLSRCSVRPVCYLLGALLLGSPGFASDPPPKPLAGAPVERVEVRIGQFDVIVRDKGGRIVPGLSPADFEVLEDGRPLEIVAVDAWGATPAAPASTASQAGTPPPVTAPSMPAAATAAEREEERRSFVIVFDAINGTSALRFTQSKRAARAFLEKNLRAEDLAAVYSLDLTLRAHTGFSSDRDGLSRAIDKIPWLPASNFGDEVAESVLAYRSRAGADYMEDRLRQQAVLEGERLDWTREHVYRNLTTLGEVFVGLPGRRVLVLVSPGMPMTTQGDVQRERGGFTPQFREMIRTMARSGVTVYTIDIGDDLAISDIAKTIDWRVAAGKIGIDENALGDLGLDAGMGAASAAYRRQFLGVVAAETGGRLLTANDLDRAFATIQEESANFYRISCRLPARSSDERYRKIAVRVRRPDAVATARRGRYSDIIPAANSASSARASVDSIDRYRALGLRVTSTPLPASEEGLIPVAVVAEVLGPAEFPADPQGGIRVDLDFFAVARVDGEIVARWERHFGARVAPGGVAAVERGFRLEGRLDLRPGVYELQTTVRTKTPAQFASWTGPLLVHPQPRGETLRFSASLLASEGAEEAPLLMSPGTPAGAIDPLILGEGARLLPPASGVLRGDHPILVLFWLRGLADGENGRPNLELSVSARNAQGAAVVPPGNLALFEPAGPGTHRAMLRLDPTSFADGAWKLLVSARDGSTGAEAKLEVPFAIVGSGSPISPRRP